MKKVLFTGCSYTAGGGFELAKQEPNLWVNILHSKTFLNEFELHNEAMGGRSNSGIFQDSVDNLTKQHYDLAFVCWTSLFRFEVDLGLELYTTRAVFAPNGPLCDHNLNDVNYSKKYLESIRDRFVTLQTPHLEILNLLIYANSLIRLSKFTGTRIFFINAICPWDNNYFEKLENVLPQSYTEYTKNLININNRDDSEIQKLYNKIHLEYNHAGGIQSNYWLNLYQSLRSLQVDVNADGLHPGIKSNQRFFELINTALEQKI